MKSSKPTNNVKDTPMSDTNTAGSPVIGTDTPVKRKRKASGPRKPQPLYVFVKVDEAGKVQVNKSTKDAREIAKWAASGGLSDPANQLLTIEF